MHRSSLGVDVDHLIHQHFHVSAIPKDTSDRLGNISRRQSGQGNLVQQRLKSVVIAPVDQHYLHWLASQMKSRLQTMFRAPPTGTFVGRGLDVLPLRCANVVSF
jgi:hypothetical protein